MSGNNDNGGDSPTLRVGDVEKEREIERRLRELGLWENKRLLESHVTSMLDARIEEKDALSRTLRNCRRKRSAAGTGTDGGVGGRTAIDEIRSIISPRVIRDRYGQRLAYHVDVLMGCFTRDVRHDLVDGGVVVISGSTGGDDDPARLTKEIRLELPTDLDMAALRVSYAAGAVKVRVPYVLEDLPKSRNVSNGDGSHRQQQRCSSISPLYSLSRQLNNRRKLGSGSSEGGGGGGRGGGGRGDDSPAVDHSPIVANGASTGTGSNLSPGSVGSGTRSLSDELQPLSPYPVFEEDEEEERTLRDNCESRIDISDNRPNSFPESFDSRSNATPNRSTDENSNNGGYRVKYDDAGNSDSCLLRFGRLSPLPSSVNHKFDQPDNTNDLAASPAEYRGSEVLNKSSGSRSKVDSMGNNNYCENAVLSKSNFRTSDFDEETDNTLRDYKVETYPPSSSRTTLNSEIVDATFENSRPCRTADGFTVTDYSKSNKASNVRKTRDSSPGSNGRDDSGMFSPCGTRSFAEENCSDQDAIATDSDFLDSDRSSTSRDRQSVFTRNNNSMLENEFTATTGRNNRVSNATEGTFSNSSSSNNNYNDYNRIRISPSDIGLRHASGLTLDATGAANGVVTNNVTFEREKLTIKSGTNQPSTARSLSSDIGVSGHQKRRSVDAVKSADDVMWPDASFVDDRSSRAPPSGEDHERSDSVYAESRRFTSPFHGNSVVPKETTLLVDIPTRAPMSGWNAVGSSAMNESKIGNVDGTTPLLEFSDKNVKERSFQLPETKIGPAKIKGEETGGFDDGRNFEVKSISDDKYASGHHQRPSERCVKVIGSAVSDQSLNGEHNRSTVPGQFEGAVGSISSSSRTRAKRSRANLNLILDSLDETFL